MNTMNTMNAKVGYSRQDLERIIEESRARLQAGKMGVYQRMAIQKTLAWAEGLLRDNPDKQRFA